MTTANKPANGTQKDIHINLSNKSFEDFPVGNLLAELFTAWEKGRYIVINENGAMVASCNAENFSVVAEKTTEHMIKFAAALLGEALPQVAQILFNIGVEYERRQNIALVAQNQKAALSAKVAAPIDSAAITKSIVDGVQEMFKAGLEQGKASHTPRVVSAVHTVQRDSSGGIATSVTNYQYEDAPGINPPPL